uniref:Uncharacterized protein n=1 Tax=Cacopsylla melanoneura TaxID=428564 RepID=A0A8D8W1W6_9HEMI
MTNIQYHLKLKNLNVVTIDHAAGRFEGFMNPKTVDKQLTNWIRIQTYTYKIAFTKLCRVWHSKCKIVLKSVLNKLIPKMFKMMSIIDKFASPTFYQVIPSRSKNQVIPCRSKNGH